VSTHSTASSAETTRWPAGLSALRGVEVAELLRVITTLHLDGLLSDTEYQATRQRLVGSR
jgi:hypothetical protein